MQTRATIGSFTYLPRKIISKFIWGGLTANPVAQGAPEDRPGSGRDTLQEAAGIETPASNSREYRPPAQSHFSVIRDVREIAQRLFAAASNQDRQRRLETSFPKNPLQNHGNVDQICTIFHLLVARSNIIC
ncbi:MULTISPECIES: hypothetical protein [Agrobacterium]|uniref:hypothetical protein n=1 Tax=Agrobacterium TaxID=357 RepID=UPI001420C277|nr:MULTISPECIES: hypothetical protein [Agrobacterium]MDH6295785.1 hypothetical protein [Agrobacterium fabrum]